MAEDKGPPGLPAASISKFGGLYRSVDPFSISPGAMETADNVVIPGPSLLMPRRGFRGVLETIVETVGNFAGAAMVYAASALKSLDVDVGTTTTISRQAGDITLAPAELSAYGSTIPATTTRARFFETNGNFYETTNFGIARVTATDSTWLPGFLPPPNQPLQAQFSLTASGTYLADDYQVAYRQTFKFTDANGVEHVSPPSQRTLVTNTSGAVRGVNVPVTGIAVDMVPVGAVLQTWRTSSTPISTTYPDVAGDEMFLIDERVITTAAQAPTDPNQGFIQAGQAGTTFFLDNTPNIPWLVDPLYTNPTTGDVNGLGIGNANAQPPACADTFSFKGRQYYANTEEAQTLRLNIIGTGTGGIESGDIVTVDGVRFFFYDTSYVALPSQYPIVRLYRTGGTYDLGSTELNIEATARTFAFIVSAVFQNGPSQDFPLPDFALANRVVVEYISPPNGIPGQLLLRRLFPGCEPFSVLPFIGDGAGWAGTLTVNNTSDSNRQPANLMQSQPNDPEAVPVAFTNVVGEAGLPILRGIPLRDYAYVFKAGTDGLWKFADDGTGTLQIGPLDQTVRLVAPETAVALDNTLFALCDKGVLRITDGGAPDNISASKIQEDLEALMRYVGPTTLARLAFAVAYETERMYVLNLPEAPNALACTVQYIYNLQTDTWTRWTIPYTTCGAVASDGDRLLLGRDPAIDGRPSLWVERKASTDNDYQDPAITTAVPTPAATGTTLTFTGDYSATLATGDLAQYIPTSDPDTIYLVRVVSSVYDGTTSTVVTFAASVPWEAADGLVVIKGVQSKVEFLPFVDGEPLYEKQWQNVYFFYRYSSVDGYSIGFSTEKEPAPTYFPLVGAPEKPYLWSETLGFGLEPWGSAARNNILRLSVNQASARSAELTVSIGTGDALTHWELSAVRVPYDATTFRVVR